MALCPWNCTFQAGSKAQAHPDVTMSSKKKKDTFPLIVSFEEQEYLSQKLPEAMTRNESLGLCQSRASKMSLSYGARANLDLPWVTGL